MESRKVEKLPRMKKRKHLLPVLPYYKISPTQERIIAIGKNSCEVFLLESNTWKIQNSKGEISLDQVEIDYCGACVI